MPEQGWLIAVVDDSPEDREAVRRHLSQPAGDYRLVEYETADDAIVDCLSTPPDCMLLDYDLRESDGLAILDKLTEGTGAPPFAIVMITGRGSESVAVQALKRGALDYVVKDCYSPEKLRAVIAESIAKFAARPEIERQRAEHERSHRAAGDSARARERLILVVDDSPEDREAVRRALSRGGGSYRFLEEGTVAEGLALCRSAGLDCLLLDYSLPDGDGLAFLDELTGGTGVTPFPVIMLTGQGDQAVAVQALKRGAVDYLVKGRYKPEALRATIEQAVERVAARRVREEQRVQVLERLEAEARRRADLLAEADRRKDEFLAMLAHELRNPLAPIRTGLQVLRLAPSEAAVERTRDMIDRQLGHPTRLVDDLLDVSRITQGKITLRKRQLDVGEAVAHVAEGFARVAAEKGHRVEVATPAEAIFAEVDPTRLEQMVGNLLGNAIKFTPAKGLIRLSVEREKAEAVIRVRDTGEGIPGAMQGQIFELFAQLDRTLDRSRGGLGIGLTVVRSLAELHGGTAEVSSPGAGCGTEVTLRLPALARPVPARDGRAPREAARGGRTHRVLIVEDNADAAELLAICLGAGGHEVSIAHDGPGGVAAARRVRPSVLICDIGLPGMDGYQVARTLRAELDPEKCLFLAVTGYGDDGDRERAREAGFDRHMTKPIDPAGLDSLLADWNGGGDASTR